MTEHKSIHEAINAVMKEVGYVQKQRSDQLKYTYAGEASLIEAIRPSMVEHGIYMTVLEVKKVYRSAYETKSGTNMFNTLMEGIVRFTHISGDHIDVEATGEGSDTGDKSSNKAMTGLYKYALRQTFCIETGDDPDRFPSDEMERSGALKSANPGKKQEQAQPKNGDATETTSVPQNGSGEGNNSYTQNQILGSKNGELVKELVSLTGKTTVDVCKFVGGLDKTKKFSVVEVAEMIKGA